MLLSVFTTAGVLAPSTLAQPNILIGKTNEDAHPKPVLINIPTRLRPLVSLHVYSVYMCNQFISVLLYPFLTAT